LNAGRRGIKHTRDYTKLPNTNVHSIVCSAAVSMYTCFNCSVHGLVWVVGIRKRFLFVHKTTSLVLHLGR